MRLQNKNFPVLQLPDYLSGFRVIAAIALVIFAITGWRLLFSWLLVIGWVTDALDGYIARKRNRTTQHGAQLDSIGDASLFLGAGIGIIIFETAFFKQHLWWLLLAAGLYFLQLGLAFWKYGKPSSFHTYSAKSAAFVQGIFLISTGFFSPWEWLFYIAISISIIDSVEEIILTFIFKKNVSNIKGLYWVIKDGRESFK